MFRTSATRTLGRLRTKQALVWLLLFIMVCAAITAQALQHIIDTSARQAAQRDVSTVAQLIASDPQLQARWASAQPGSSSHESSAALRVRYFADPNAAVADTSLDAATRAALSAQLARATHNRSATQPVRADDRGVWYAVPIGPGVALIDEAVAPRIAELSRQFVRIYLVIGILICVCVGGFVLLLGKARRELRTAFAEGRTRVEELERPVPRTKDRNLLLPIVAFTLAVFGLDVWLSISAIAGAAYALAIMWSLSSNRRWHIGAMVAWTLTLHFAASFIHPPSEEFSMTLSLHALVTFMLAAIAAYGLGLSKRARSESMIAARAAVAQQESKELRSALTRAEAADTRMRTALDRLTLATQYAGISVWEWDLVVDLIYAAEGSDFGARLGFNTHMRGGEYVRNFVHPEDRDDFAAAFRVAITGERPDGQIVHRYRSHGVDGTMQYIQLHARVYRNEQGQAVRVVGVDWNVTHEVEREAALQRQTEQLRDAERRLERASISSLEGHWETDLLSGQVWISSSFRELMAFAPGQFEALHIAVPELAHPDDRARHEAAYLAHLQKRTPFDLQLRLRDGRGEYRWFRMQGAVQRDSDDRPVKLSGSIHDITEQHRAEEALRMAQARFERAINGTQDGLFDMDIPNNAVWVSPRYYELLGDEGRAEPISVSELHERVHPDDQARVDEALRDLVKTNRPFDVEYRLRRSSGEYLWVRCRAAAEFGRDGRAIRLSGSIQDITDARRANEQLLRATATAEAANEAKSVFLATMSHEIRTPLNGVIGMASLLLDTDLARVQREYAATIRNSADSLLHVLNDILDFSKIEAGKLDIDLTDMDLRTNVEEVCATVALQAAAKQIELVVDLRPEVPELVRGDAQRIRQCLLNLLSNAVKFTHAGEILVEACVLAQQAGKTLVQFLVRDTGIGLTPEQMSTLFQPFVQADSTTAKRYGGSGLGLSIVKRLVELMGGQVGVESEPSKGSIFWFTLPLEPLDPSGRFARMAAGMLGKRILVVDDNATNRKVLAGQLERVGFEVEGADEAAAALQLLREACDANRPFDAALIDLQMPSMDGAALGEAINADSQLRATRLVLLTSLDRPDDQQRCAALGFAAYLTKPVRARELRDCLERVLAVDASEWHMHTQPMMTLNALGETFGEPAYGGTILLVEDNLINQQVAQKYLERLGCSVYAVSDGRAAVEACKERRFNLVLMDMQMPVMDGITATGELRALDKPGRRLPIVALTANAMADQLVRCLDAGMDDFLSKPLDVQRLRDVLDRFGLATRHAADRDDHRIDVDAPIDLARVAALADGDPEQRDRLLRTFLDSVHQSLSELHDAVAQMNRAGAAQAAHKLNGTAGSLGAHRLRQLAVRLESAAEQLNDLDTHAALHALDMETVRIQTAIDKAS